MLLRTTDGGASWTVVATPIAGGLVFHTSSDAWIAGGPQNDKLFVTHDGGTTWVPEQIPLSAGRTTIARPYFIDRNTGIVPVQEHLDTGSRLLFYITEDNGRSWKLSGAALDTPRGGDLFAGAFSLGSFVDRSNWYILGGSLLVTHDGGASFASVNSTRDLSGVSDIQFVSSDVGWAEETFYPCPRAAATADGKPSSTCAGQTRLLRTADGGKNWREQPLP
ncbi:MAG: hypothetical protein LC721_05455 [Actinobacteria bacterium]|nr:hypothetical protein [Actinomycetota bacterium]